jgi:lipopolysaccharide transport system ATP-binding protein
MQPIIEVRGLGKRYRLGEIGARSLREEIENLIRRVRNGKASLIGNSVESDQSRYYWALREVSFDVMPGEVVGIIGKNGAGKSTLFKLLSRITEPTTGEAFMRGRVASLLEVGTGFHPELSGRENIFLSGTIMGMSRREIATHFDEIVDFAEVGNYLDTPVKRYSSGMYVRLGFAIAAHLTCEILIVDEVLAVGDADFQRKCLGKMHTVAREGRTVLFVSHSMPTVQNLCSRAIWLSGGSIQADGEPAEIISSYLEAIDGGLAQPLRDRTDRTGNRRGIVTEIRVISAGLTAGTVSTSGETIFEISYDSFETISQPVFALGVYDNRLNNLVHLSSSLASWSFGSIKGKGSVVCKVPFLPCHPGNYTLNVTLHDGPELVDRVEHAAQFRVVPADFYGTGKSLLPHQGMIQIKQVWDAPTGSDSKIA